MSHARYALSEDEDAPAPAPPVLASEPVKHADVDDDRPAIHRLTHAWLNERGSPELLPWPGDLVDTVMDQLQQQQAILDSLTSDTATSDEEHFRLNLVQLDADRCRWLLRSFLRTRLDKVEKNASYIVRERSEQVRLSDMELGYAKRYAQLLADHLSTSVLQFLPESMRGLDDPAPGTSMPNAPGGMLAAPSLDTPVFVYGKEDGGSLTLPDAV
ncbi:GINS complex subunit [Malassezia equina]|uniref:GINS complex subunit n=1 Tax=Malassezia equina TaxID=1381935 RepID=A0AAF0J3M4_9BASI|nr:GINS complex subunit [Malassezia equina]